MGEGSTLIDEEFRRSWPIVAAGALGFGLGLSGLPFYTVGVFVDPLMQAFGWKAAQVQSGMLVMLWSTVGLSPAAGWAVDRFGSRRVASVSVLLFGLAFMSLGLSGPDIGLFRLRWFVIAVAGAGTLPLVWGKVISLRFGTHRGLALGLVLAGSGLTGIFAPPLAKALIDAFGWRVAYAVLGALPPLFALPCVFAVLPRQAPAPPPPSAVLGASTPVPEGASVARALASPRFWLIALCIGAVAAAASGCISNLVKILVAGGQPRSVAVWIASLVGLFVVAGRAASGALIDRLWAPGVAAVFLAAPTIGCLLLAVGPPGALWASLAAILIGLAAGAEFDLLAYLLAAYFGLRRYGAIYGFASAIFGLAAGAAPLVFAAVFDASGSYRTVLLGAAGVFALGGFSLLGLGSCPRPALREAGPSKAGPPEAVLDRP